jgi:hypothetical protein
MRLFISHVHEEYAVAEAVRRQLDQIFAEMVDVFLSENVKLGTDWLQEIKGALSAADIILVLFSPTSQSRPWINIEAGYGVMSGKMVVPVCHRGLTKDKLPTIYGLRQALELGSRTDIAKLLQTIAEATAAKRLLVPDLAAVIDKWVTEIAAAEAISPPYVRPIGTPICVWLIGSVNRVAPKYRKRAFKAADALADEFIHRGYQVLSGRSLLLDYIADRVASNAIDLSERALSEVTSLLAVKSARTATPIPNPVIILGLLRSERGVRQLFMDTIGKIPDVAVVLGGAPGGLAVAEVDLARQARIPILPLKFTGGVAEQTETTFAPALAHAVNEFVKTLPGSDVIGRRASDLIEQQIAINRDNPTAA